MSTIIQNTQTSPDFIGLPDRTSTVVDANLAVLTLFCALGLLASLYVMIHFPAEDFLAAWL